MQKEKQNSSLPPSPTLTTSFPPFSPPIYCDVNNNNNGARAGKQWNEGETLDLSPTLRPYDPSLYNEMKLMLNTQHESAFHPETREKAFSLFHLFFFPSKLSAPVLSTGVHNIPSFQVLELLHSYEAVWRYRLRVYFPTPGVHYGHYTSRQMRK